MENSNTKLTITPDTETINWIEIFDVFFRDCFKFWKREEKPVLIAYEIALEKTKKLRHNPFTPKSQEVDYAILSAWGEKYTNVLNDLYKADANNQLNENNIRFCNHCDIPMINGYYLAGEYACSDKCALELYNGDETQMKEDLSHAEEDDGECYWTEWESIHFNQ